MGPLEFRRAVIVLLLSANFVIPHTVFVIRYLLSVIFGGDGLHGFSASSHVQTISPQPGQP